MAGIGWPDHILMREEMMRVFAPTWTDAERESLRGKFEQLQHYFLDASRREARAGARVVITPETSLFALSEDEPALLERARQLARDEDVHLLLGMATIRLGAARPVEDKAIFIDSSGSERIVYMKASAVPGLEARTNVRGPWRILTSDTPGRLTPRWQVRQVTSTAGTGRVGMVSSRRLISSARRIICRATRLVRFSSLGKSSRSSGIPSSPTWQNWQRTPSPPAKLRIVPMT
jgi:hypothetical protein